MKRTCLLAFLSAALCLPAAAQTGDSSPPDVNQLLAALKQIRELNDAGIKARRTAAWQKVSAAAATNEAAVAFWKEAVKAVQFEGSANENAQVRDWKESDGEALSDKLAAGAVRLHLQWLAYSLQHAAGADRAKMPPQIIEFTKLIQADQLAAERFAENLDKTKERRVTGSNKREEIKDDAIVKRVHEQVLRMPVGGSPVARWLQLGELLGDAGRKPKPGGAAEKGGGGWENSPGNVDGIYASIILPEFRASKDPRLLEYWDMAVKREGERVTEKKLDVELRDWRTVKLPKMLWARAQDVAILGYRNRAIGDMFTIIKNNPQHPDITSWISHLETTLAPTFDGSTPTPPPPSGAVARPLTVPPATAAPPTATLVQPVAK